MHIDVAVEKKKIQDELRSVKDAIEQREHELGQVKTYAERLLGRLEYLVGLEKKDAEDTKKPEDKVAGGTADKDAAGNTDPAQPAAKK